MHLDSNRRGQKKWELWLHTNHILDPVWHNIYFADALPNHKRIIMLTRRPSFLHQGGFRIGSLPQNKGTRNPTSTASLWRIFSQINWNWRFIEKYSSHRPAEKRLWEVSSPFIVQGGLKSPSTSQELVKHLTHTSTPASLITWGLPIAFTIRAVISRTEDGKWVCFAQVYRIKMTFPPSHH